MNRLRTQFLLLTSIMGCLMMASEHIPLEKAIDASFQRHITLGQYRASSEESRHLTRISEKSRLPVVHIGGSARYQSENISVNFPQNMQVPFSMPNIEGSHSFYDINLGIQYPLLTGGRLKSSLQLARLSENASDLQIRLVKARIGRDVRQLYIASRLLDAKEAAFLAMKNSLELHKHRLEELYSAGLSSRADLIQSEEKLVDIELTLLEMSRSRQKIGDQFRDMSGMDIDRIDPWHREVIPVDDEWRSLIPGHPSLELITVHDERLKALHRMTTAEYRPSISLFTELHGGMPGVNMLGDEWSVYGIAGLSFRMTLFDFQRKKEHQAVYTLRKRQAQFEKSRQKEQLSSRIELLYKELGSLEKQLPSIDRLIDLAQEFLKHQERLWQQNQASHTDYLTALEHLTQQKSRKDQLFWQIEGIKGEINFALNTLEGE